MHLNNYELGYILGALIAFFVVSSLFPTRKILIIFLAYSNLLAIFAFFNTDTQLRSLLIISALTITAVNFISFYSKESLLKSVYEMSSFFLLDKNPVIRFSYQGEILHSNSASKEIINYWLPEKSVLLNDTWLNRVQYLIKNNKSFQTQINFNNKTFKVNLAPNQEFQHINIYAEDISEDIENQKLIQEQQMKMINSSKYSELGIMAASIAHEINNPLTIIIGRTRQIELAIKEIHRDPDKTKTVIETSASSLTKTAYRISKIINTLKTLSQNGENEGAHKISLIEVINDTLEFSSSRVSNLSIKLIINHIDDVFINGKSVELSQVLLNLINNSIDEIVDSEKPWISVSSETDSDYTYLKITDSGHGIPKHVQDKIFQPFFTTKNVNSGTGLGLSLCHSIVKAHAGDLYINNSCENTQFIIKLPLYTHSKKSAA